MGAPGFELEAQEAQVLLCIVGKKHPMRDGIVPLFIVNAALHHRIGRTSDGSIDRKMKPEDRICGIPYGGYLGEQGWKRAVQILKMSPCIGRIRRGAGVEARGSFRGRHEKIAEISRCDGEVFALDFVRTNHVAETGGREHVFRRDQKTTRVLIKAVHDAIDVMIVAEHMMRIPAESIAEGVLIVAHGWMNREPGRFIDHKDILILIDDGQWDFGLDDVWTVLGFENPADECIAGRERLLQPAAMPVSDKTLCVSKMIEHGLRVALGTKKSLHGVPVEAFWNSIFKCAQIFCHRYRYFLAKTV